MFLTITIDTSREKKQLVKLRKTKINARKGWRKADNSKKFNFIQKLKSWRNSFKVGYYKLGKQITMF